MCLCFSLSALVPSPRQSRAQPRIQPTLQLHAKSKQTKRFAQNCESKSKKQNVFAQNPGPKPSPAQRPAPVASSNPAQPSPAQLSRPSPTTAQPSRPSPAQSKNQKTKAKNKTFCSKLSLQTFAQNFRSKPRTQTLYNFYKP